MSNPSEDSDLDVRLAPEKVTTLLDSNQYKLPTEGIHRANKLYRNSTVHKTVYDTERIYKDGTATNLLQYSDGHRVPVIYFSQVNPSLLGKNNPTDISTGETHSSHTSYLKIIDFQLALDGPIEPSYSEDDGYMSVTGAATTLPGFIPKKGDIFYFLISDNQWGIMVIRSVQRLAISSVTRHRVTFELQEYLSQSRQEYLEQQVVDTAYFDKLMYFNQPYTLLKHDAYILFNKLQVVQKEITQYYHDKFYSSIVRSYLHPGPEGYYDPYLVEYLQNKVSIKDMPRIRRPKQLYSRLDNYTSSIWAKLSGEPIDIANTDIKYNFRLVPFRPTFWSGDVTSLAGRPYVELTNEVDTDSREGLKYGGLTYGFYTGDIPSMTDYERILYSVMLGEYTDINPTTIYDKIKAYGKWEAKYAYYHIPIAMYLIDKALFILND